MFLFLFVSSGMSPEFLAVSAYFFVSTSYFSVLFTGRDFLLEGQNPSPSLVPPYSCAKFS